jgi:hypothetical protein
VPGWGGLRHGGKGQPRHEFLGGRRKPRRGRVALSRLARDSTRDGGLWCMGLEMKG